MYFALMEHATRPPVLVVLPRAKDDDDAIEWGKDHETGGWEFIKVLAHPVIDMTAKMFERVCAPPCADSGVTKLRSEISK